MDKRKEFEAQHPRPTGVAYDMPQDRYIGFTTRNQQERAEVYQKKYEAWLAGQSPRPTQAQLAAGREAFEAMHAGPPNTWPGIDEFLTRLYEAMLLPDTPSQRNR